MELTREEILEMKERFLNSQHSGPDIDAIPALCDLALKGLGAGEDCARCGRTSAGFELFPVHVCRDCRSALDGDAERTSKFLPLQECAIQLAILLNSIESKKGAFHTNEADALKALQAVGYDVHPQPWFGTPFSTEFNEGHMRVKLAALSAQPSAPAGWRPIAEAPKEGKTPVLTYGPAGRVVAGFQEGRWFIHAGHVLARHEYPTHFMLLPLAPTGPIHSAKQKETDR